MIFQLPTLSRLLSTCIATSAFSLLWISHPACPAHEWHQPHDDSGNPNASAGFLIPEEAGQDPDNSAEVAERAEAFAPFFPGVRTRWDDQWLYVENNGMPDHGMMAGVTNW